MQEIEGDLWSFWERGSWVVITTNGTLNSKGQAVMGRGVALEAKRRVPLLPQMLGHDLARNGLRVVHFYYLGIICFPTKGKDWRLPASLDLIERSAWSLAALVNRYPLEITTPVYMVRPGCGVGGLKWEDVRPIIAPVLDDRFIIVNKGDETP